MDHYPSHGVPSILSIRHGTSHRLDTVFFFLRVFRIVLSGTGVLPSQGDTTLLRTLFLFPSVNSSTLIILVIHSSFPIERDSELSIHPQSDRFVSFFNSPVRTVSRDGFFSEPPSLLNYRTWWSSSSTPLPPSSSVSPSGPLGTVVHTRKRGPDPLGGLP